MKNRRRILTTIPVGIVRWCRTQSSLATRRSLKREVDLEDLALDLNGDEWGEWVESVRWVKPGVFSFKTSITYRSGQRR